jgi:co-chaperonin GroES (HSP10)
MPVEEPLFQASNKYRATNQVDGIRALHDHVIVRDMNFGARKLASGIFLLNDDGKTEGIRPRWARVYAVGPDQQDVKVGQWVFIEHGRWTRKIKINDGNGDKEFQKVEVTSVIAVADERPNDFYIGQEFSNGSSMNINPEDFMPGNLSKIS